MRFQTVVLIAVTTVVFAACASPLPEATAPTALPTPVATAAPATAYPAPTPVPSPTPRPTTSPTPPPQRQIEVVRARGQLRCGVEAERPGFALADGAGNPVGLEVDICRAIAAAVLGDADAVEVRALSRRELLVALKGSAIDVLGATAVVTEGDELATELKFAPAIFDDGATMLTYNVTSLADLARLKDASVCVERGSPAEQALAAYFLAHNKPVTAVVYGSSSAALDAYAAGECAALAGSRSQLAFERQAFRNPAAHLILDELLNNAPRAPAVSSDDPSWLAIVSAVINGMLQAEELGVSTESLADLQTSTDPAIRQLLRNDSVPGLPSNFMARVIQQVGNYGEVYDRHLGPVTTLDIPRTGGYDK